MIDLSERAKALVAEGKGVLAADESTPSADKRLALYGIAGDPETRRQFRALFLEAPGAEEFLSGVILYSETAAQAGDSGAPFPALLAAKGIAPGIKVDEGTEPMPESPAELITKGLIGLPERLAPYAAQDFTFAKWRAVVRIDGDRLPTPQAIVENAKRLAAYAADAQKAGIVPFLEPEMLYDGAHSRLRARAVLEDTLKALFAALADQSVDISGVILKTAMVLSGKGSGRMDTPEEVAQDTVEVLIACVPKQVPGIVFLSGGQTPDQATDNLRAIAARGASAGAPWPLTFSYARALQEEALAAWKGKPENVPAAREAFLARMRAVSAASRGL